MSGKHTKIVWMVCLVVLLFAGMRASSRPRPGKGFRLCMQSYTFQRFTLEQAMDKTCELGIKYLEIFPGQRFGGYQSVEHECNWEDSVPDIRE